MIIRKATIHDLPVINLIYNQAVASKCTGDTSPVMMDQRIEWFNTHSSSAYPVFVAVMEDKVVGWLSFSPYRNGRSAFRHTAEISYYIHHNHHRQGIGSELIAFAIKTAPAYDFKNIFAIILETNTASIKLMQKFKFQQWAMMPAIADFDGEITGHVYYGINLIG